MGLWPSLDSLHHRGPKEGREALSKPSILWQPVSWILSICTPHPSAPPQAASKASPGLAVPGRAWHEGQGILQQVPLWAAIGRVALGGGGMRVTLAGLPRDRESRGQMSTVQNDIIQGIISFWENKKWPLLPPSKTGLVLSQR